MKTYSSENCADAMVRDGLQEEADNYIDNEIIRQQSEEIERMKAMAVTDKEIAEKVGYYFGLQRAGNMMPGIRRGEEGSKMLNALRGMIDAEMDRVIRGLPPGIVETWPNQVIVTDD